MRISHYLPNRRSVYHHLSNKELLILDVCFIFLTLCGVFVTYRVLVDVVPFPIFITGWQLVQGLVMAYIFGEFGREYPAFSYFPRVQLDQSVLSQLIIPTIPYFAMMMLSNKLLHEIENPAAYPVILTIMVVMHHFTRFFGCGEEYLLLRWQSIGLLLLAFFFGYFDSSTVSQKVLPWAIAYALASAVFRGAVLQKIIHMVNGRGNVLHNHQHVIGAVFALIMMFVTGEIFPLMQQLPFNFNRLYTWQFYGCLISTAAIPFFKNVVSNRLIRKTGQGPWRFFEIVSILLIFFFGIIFFKNPPNLMGFFAIIITIVGRTFGAIDIMRNSERAVDYFNRVGKTETPTTRMRSQNSFPLVDDRTSYSLYGNDMET